MSITALVNGQTIGAEHHLALMVKMHLGVDVDPEKLKSFVLAKWAPLSHMAHSIHERADEPSLNDNAGIPVA